MLYKLFTFLVLGLRLVTMSEHLSARPIIGVRTICRPTNFLPPSAGCMRVS